QLMEPLPTHPLTVDCRLTAAVSMMNTHKLDFCCVVNGGGKLIGIITRSDLLRAIEVAAAAPEGSELTIGIKDIMVKDPVCVGINDSTALAVLTMREHGLKALPVLENNQSRMVKGYVRIENIMDHLMKRMLVHDGTTPGAAPHVTKQLTKPAPT